jgi:hypothetical protein
MKSHILEVVISSFKEALGRYPRLFKGIFAYFFSSIGGALATYNKFIVPNQWISFLIGFILGSVVLFLGLWCIVFLKSLWRKWVLVKRESIYGEAVKVLANGFSLVHSLSKKANVEKTEVKEVLVGFCNEVKKIFDKKTGTKCAVSIKVFRGSFDAAEDVLSKAKVSTLCRDSISESRESPNYKSTNHTVLGNTCFRTIITNFLLGKTDKMYFLSNNLVDIDGYANTSLEVNCQIDETKWPNKEYRKTNWPLDYKSELVVSFSPLDLTNVNEMPLLGFICIDCPLNQGEIFNLDYDVIMMKGVADGLYDFTKLNLYNFDDEKDN